MFTGMINSIGTVARIDEMQDDRRITIDARKLDMQDANTGDSICCNGVCLTVIDISDKEFITDISVETLSCTTFKDLVIGSQCNLEKAMKMNDRLGGHLVTGHVDGLGKIIAIDDDARSCQISIEVPHNLSKYICKKGSVSVDGVSLTVNDVSDSSFDVNIIPHTLSETIFHSYQKGILVNIEVDIIARYLERLLSDTH